jgi:hypothetical protein
MLALETDSLMTSYFCVYIFLFWIYCSLCAIQCRESAQRVHYSAKLAFGIAPIWDNCNQIQIGSFASHQRSLVLCSRQFPQPGWDSHYYRLLYLFSRFILVKYYCLSLSNPPSFVCVCVCVCVHIRVYYLVSFGHHNLILSIVLLHQQEFLHCL